jgi:hypothetical protein
LFVQAMRKRERILESQQVRLFIFPSVSASSIRQIILFWLSMILKSEYTVVVPEQILL